MIIVKIIKNMQEEYVIHLKEQKFEQGDRDGKWSDSDYEENVESFNYLNLVFACLLYVVFMVCMFIKMKFLINYLNQ